MSDPSGNKVGDPAVGYAACDKFDQLEGASGTPAFGEYKKFPKTEAAIEVVDGIIGDVSGYNGAADPISTAISGGLSGVVLGAGEIVIGKTRAAAKIFEPVISYGQKFCRGARPGQIPDLTPRPNEYKVEPETGFVRPTHDVSVIDNPENVASKGVDPHQIDQSIVPDSLDIIQRGVSHRILKLSQSRVRT